MVSRTRLSVATERDWAHFWHSYSVLLDFTAAIVIPTGHVLIRAAVMGNQGLAANALSYLKKMSLHVQETLMMSFYIEQNFLWINLNERRLYKWYCYNCDPLDGSFAWCCAFGQESTAKAQYMYLWLSVTHRYTKYIFIVKHWYNGTVLWRQIIKLSWL